MVFRLNKNLRRKAIRTKGINPFCYLPLTIFLLLSCALDIPEDAFDYLNPPSISCYQLPGDTEHIYINYTGYNKEYYFDGYNVYVSDTQMLRSSIGTYSPIPVTAEIPPTYPLPPTGAQSGTIIVDRFRSTDGDTYPFVNNVKYWIMLCSHHRQLGVNEYGVSNQISITFTK
jgi:hypothetical protein